MTMDQERSAGIRRTIHFNGEILIRIRISHVHQMHLPCISQIEITIPMQDVSISIFLKPADGWIEMIPMEVTDKEVNFISAICNHFFHMLQGILIIVKNENYVVDFQNESAVIQKINSIV